MEKQRYITIQEWMTELKLHPSELIVFSIIWGFSQDGRSKFVGSAEYLQHWTGLSRQAVVAILKNLIEKDLIIRLGSPLDKRYVDYQVNIEALEKISKETLQTQDDLSRNLTHTCQETLQTICQETLHHNNREHKIIDNKEIDLPYHSVDFISTWQTLIKQPKWKGKTKDALRLSARKLGEVSEQDAIQMMQNTIMNGWQGLFPIKTNQYGNRNTETNRIHITEKQYGDDTI